MDIIFLSFKNQNIYYPELNKKNDHCFCNPSCIDFKHIYKHTLLAQFPNFLFVCYSLT